MSAGLQPDTWHDLFLATAGAAAALLGLIFVAVSLHPHDVERQPAVRLRVRVNLQALAAILALSLCALLPGQGGVMLGVELLLVTAVYVALIVGGSLRTARMAGGLPATTVHRLWAQNTPLLALQVAAGLSLIYGWGPGLYLEAPLLVIGLPVTLFNCWNVLFASELQSGPTVEAPIQAGTVRGQASGDQPPRQTF